MNRLRFGVCCLLSLVVLCASTRLSPVWAEDAKPIRALLIAGGCCHDYLQQKDLIAKGISARANVQWKIAYDADKGTSHLNPIFDSADWAKGFDVIVHDECSAGIKDLDAINRVLKPHRDGLPAVVLHCAMHCFRSEGFPKETPWFEFTGLPSTGHGPSLPIEVRYTDKDSPITKGLADWTTINEELYNNSAGKQVVKAKDGKERVDEYVVTWTNLYAGKARVFGTTLGHQNGTVDDERYLNLITAGLLWSVNKLDDAHMKPAQKVYLDQ
jgi:type 1 glutamine amidotransferase